MDVRSTGSRPAVFLDRDGTLHEELEAALVEPGAMRFFPGVFEAAARLSEAGFELVVITNQSAIARGELDHERLARVHAHLRERFAQAGAPLAGVFVCPHHPSAGDPPYRRICNCRKPASGLFTDAADQLGLDLRRSWVIGDALRDLEAGAKVGVRTVLVATGKGAREREKVGGELASRTLFAPDFASAVDLLLRARGA